MPALKLRLVSAREEREYDFRVPLVLGRQEALASGQVGPAPFTLTDGPEGSQRLVVGWNPEADTVSRQHALLEPLPDGTVRVTNTSNHLLLHGTGLPATGLTRGEQRILTPPFHLSFGNRWGVHVIGQATRAEAGSGDSLASRMYAPGDSDALDTARKTLPAPDLGRLEEGLDWLVETAGLLQSAAATDDFLARAAQTLVKVIGLHSGRVLLREGGEWRTAHTHLAPGVSAPAELSQHLLAALLERKETKWIRPPVDDPSRSLRGLDTVVAAPLLGHNREVVGALYGEYHRTTAVAPSARVNAALMMLLANAVAASLARRQAEARIQQAERDRALFQQFFPRDLAEQLSRDRSLIDRATQKRVTVLFCDVRGFSAASERLGAEKTFAWMSNVLDTLSQCVERHGGVLVDFIGDELMAMWGAPTDQPDHAARAVRAALEMLRTLEPLDRESRSRYGTPTAIGIGINSGEALVGNVGSASKLKYGPLGDTVNTASRIQGVTKYLKVPILVSASTWEDVREGVTGRFVVQARLTGMKEARDLYEVAAPDSGKGPFFAQSESALRALRDRQFSRAVRESASLLNVTPGDGPLRLVLSRASQALVSDGEGFDFVWTPPGK